MIRAALALALLAPAAVHAQELRDFCANRPGKDSPACILDTGHWQVEGDLLDQVRDHGVVTNSIADLQIRYGSSRRTELQLSWAPFLSQRSNGVTTTGSSDLVLGARIALTDPDGKGAAISLQPFVAAPTSSKGFGSGRWEGGIALPASLPLSDVFSLSVTPQIASAADSARGGDHVVWSGGAGLGVSLGTLALGLELWGAADQDPAGHRHLSSFDINTAWQPSTLKDTQFDIGLSAGLSSDTPAQEWYAGVAKRF